ncbi:MAG: aminoacyl-tRNA deacylase [Caulobacteraceae bacterium]
MSISPKLQSYLDRRCVQYEKVPHTRALSAVQAAHAAEIDDDRLAKAVLVRAGDEYMLAVVPASRHVVFDQLQRWLGKPVRLAEERESEDLFADCDLGAIPPVGSAYGLETVMDDSLVDAEDIYFEGGDHRTLVHMRAADWRKLMKDTAHGAFSA